MRRAVRKRLKLLKFAKSRDTTACIFCGRNNVTKEHVFSRWTHKYMLPRQQKKATSVIGVETDDGVVESAEFKMPGEMRDWQIECVCGGGPTTCNNGWMRDLDNLAEPIMKPLILGDRATLGEADQKIIATWAILKVMVVHHRIVHHARRKQMRAVREPMAGWSVWIGNYHRQNYKLEWQSRPFPVLPNKTYAKRRSRNVSLRGTNCVATTQIIKNLFIHVVYCPMEDFGTRWRFTNPQGGPLSGHLIRIWPTRWGHIFWPEKALTDADAFFAADAVYVGVKRIAKMIKDGVLTPPSAG